MSSPSPVRMTDDLIARALARPPDAAVVAEVADAVAEAILARPQRRHATLGWPALPRLGLVAGSLVVVGLLLLLAVALVVVGSRIPRPGPIGIGVNGLVVFDEEGAIRVARSDGTSQGQLTSGSPWTFAPSVSPDGRRVAYWSTPEADLDVHTPRDLEVRELGTAAGPAATLVHASGGVAWRIAWSPDSSRLAWADIVDGRRTVFVVGLDGREARPVSPRHARCLGSGLVAGWGVDRVSRWPRRGRPGLLRDAAGRHERSPRQRGAFTGPGVLDPGLVADLGSRGRRSRDRRPGPVPAGHLGAAPADGTQVDISNDPGDEFAAAWSPDATRIA